MTTEASPDQAVDTGATVIADPRRRLLVLIAVCAALMAVVSSVSGLNVAQQAIARELGASQDQILWAVNGYTIALAALLISVGAVGDRWGRKPLLLLGLVVFAAGNVAAALAGAPEMLIAGRVVAGAGAAMVMPTTLSIITSSFPEEARGTAVGIWAGLSGAGAIIGLLFTAVIVDNVTWPWLFAFPVGLALAAGLLAVAVVPNSRVHRPGRFDTAGSILSILAVGGIVLGVHEGPESGWSDPLTLAGLAVGIVALVGFAVRELHTADPLLDIRVFANRALSSGMLALVLLFGVMFGMFVALPQYTQGVLGYSAVRAVVAVLPLAVILVSLSPFAPKLLPRLGLRTMLLTGALLVTVGLVVMAEMVNATSYWSIFPGLLLVGLGLASTMTPATTAITGSLSRARQGVASALNDTSREVGSALGIALLGSVLNSQYRSHISDVAASLTPAQGARVESGIPGAGEVAQDLGRDGLTVIVAARQALVDAWSTMMWVGAAIALGAAVLIVVLSLGSKGRQDMAAHGGLDHQPTDDDDASVGVPVAAGAATGTSNGAGGNGSGASRDDAGAPEQHVGTGSATG